MANKNTKNRKLLVRAAGKAGNSELVLEVPVFNYHSQQKTATRPVTFHTSRVRGDNTVSTNRRRNMAMRVYVNKDANGVADSITRHEPMVPREYITYKGHNYINYRQPRVEKNLAAAA